MSEPTNNQTQVRIRAPKGMKTSKAVKRLATLLPFDTTEARRSYIKSIAMAEHDAKYNAKKSNKEARSGNRTTTTATE
jgi:hypothetical protein